MPLIKFKGDLGLISIKFTMNVLNHNEFGKSTLYKLLVGF